MGNARWGWKVLGFGLFYLLAFILAAFPVFMLLEVLKYHPYWRLFLEIGLNAVAAALVTWVFLKLEGRSFQSIGFRLDRRWGMEVLAGTLLGGVILVMVATLLLAAGGVHWVKNPWGAWWDMAAGCLFFLLVALHEELVFRGYMFQRLVENLGPWPAQLLMGLAFMAIHLNNAGISSAQPLLKAITLINITLAGFLMGLAWLKTRSLALPVGIHFGWNYVQGNVLGFGVSGTSMASGFWRPMLHGPDWLTGGAVGLEGSVLCTVACLLGIALLAVFRKQVPE